MRTSRGYGEPWGRVGGPWLGRTVARRLGAECNICLPFLIKACLQLGLSSCQTHHTFTPINTQMEIAQPDHSWLRQSPPPRHRTVDTEMMYTQHVTRLHTPPLHRLIIDCLDTHRHTQSSPVWLFPEKDLSFQEEKSKPLRGAASSQRQARKLTLVCQTGYLNLAPASAAATWDGAFHRDAKAPFLTLTPSSQ